MTQDLLQRLDRASDQVSTARALIAAGEVRDLAPIQAAVEEICTAIRTLPGPQRAPFEKRLVALLDDVDRLTVTIREQLAQLTQETKSADRHRQAASAYGRAAPGRRS